MDTSEFEVGFLATLRALPAGRFSTAEFIEEYRSAWPEEWRHLESRHGVGGKGAGQHHTVFTVVAKQLSKLARAGEIAKLDYYPAPDWWGNAVVQAWSTSSNEVEAEDATPIDPEYREGTVRLKVHMRKERAWGLAKNKKRDFVARHGKLFCERCGLDPANVFGSELGEAVIEVHHAATMIAEMGQNHKTKLTDLQCLCANCHRITHAEIVRDPTS